MPKGDRNPQLTGRSSPPGGIIIDQPRQAAGYFEDGEFVTFDSPICLLRSYESLEQRGAKALIDIPLRVPAKARQLNYGQHDAAIRHFREAHRLVPDSWTFRRQAWSLKPVGEGPLARFWQGPDPEDPQAWPYEGDWLTDIRATGAQNYNDPWRP